MAHELTEEQKHKLLGFARDIYFFKANSAELFAYIEQLLSEAEERAVKRKKEIVKEYKEPEFGSVKWLCIQSGYQKLREVLDDNDIKLALRDLLMSERPEILAVLEQLQSLKGDTKLIEEDND